MPLVAAVQPLKTVVVHLASERNTRRKSTISETRKSFSTRYLVNVSYEKDIALLWSLCASQRKYDLLEESIPSKALMLPCITIWHVGFRQV